MRQQEFANLRIEREAVYSLPGGVHHHRAGSVDHVARSNLTTAGLEHVLHLAASATGDLAQHGEDRPHRNVDVDVGRSVQRIEQ